jgi:hypothetical protein
MIFKDYSLTRAASSSRTLPSPPPVSPRSRAFLVVTEGQRPHPRHAHRHGGRLRDPADDGAVGEHVEVVIVPLAGR